MSNNLSYFIKTSLAILKGDDAMLVSLRNQRNAISALEIQIKYHENEISVLEDQITDLAGPESKALVNNGNVLETDEQRERYIDNLLACRRTSKEKIALVNGLKDEVSFLKEKLALVSRTTAEEFGSTLKPSE